MKKKENHLIHDLKAPLKSIKGFSDLIEEELKRNDTDNQVVMSHLSYIKSSIISLEDFIEDFFKLTKSDIADTEFEKIDLKKIIERQLFKLRYQINLSNIQIKLNDLGFIYGDKRSLAILFCNFITNAIKFQPKNEAHVPSLKISQVNKNKEILIKIEDNGIGIAEKYYADMFIPFKRLHSCSTYEGTGLGLSICLSIIEKHKGRIEVESELDSGTLFKIFIPK